MLKLLKSKKFIYFLISIAVLIWLFMLSTETGILLFKKDVWYGDDYFVEHYRNWGDQKLNPNVLLCKYFDGRRIVTDAKWYSGNNFSDFLKKNGCSFIKSFKEGIPVLHQL